MWTTHSTETVMQPHQRNGSAHVPAGTLFALSCERYLILCRHSRSWIEELSGFQRRVHDDRKLSCDRHSSSFEADPFSQLKPHVRNELCTERRVRITAAASYRSPRKWRLLFEICVHHNRFTGLIAARGEADPCTHGS